MGVHKRNGVVYLDVHKLPERPQSELDRRRYKIMFPFIYSWEYEYLSPTWLLFFCLYILENIYLLLNYLILSFLVFSFWVGVGGVGDREKAAGKWEKCKAVFLYFENMCFIGLGSNIHIWLSVRFHVICILVFFQPVALSIFPSCYN